MNPTLWVNKTGLIENLQVIKSKTKSNFICPMVKANAYGVGDSLVVSTLLSTGVKYFGVARTFEGEKLRRFFPSEKFEILVFNSFNADNIESYLNSSLTPVVGDKNSIEVLKKLSKDQLLKIKEVHVKFDLGMSRFGFSFSEAGEVLDVLTSLGLQLGGVCGHFSKSEDFSEKKSESKKSLADLVACAKEMGVSEDKVHAANTAAIERGSFDVGLRPGIGLYGVSQYAQTDLKGVLRLTAPIVALNSISAGQKVSYGGSWEAKAPGRIGILPIGYADGLRRGLSNRIKFLLKGKAYSQVGAICMDYCMVDFGDDETIKIGDEITLFDESATALLEWADLLGTIPYELLSGLGERIERKAL